MVGVGGRTGESACPTKLRCSHARADRNVGKVGWKARSTGTRLSHEAEVGGKALTGEGGQIREDCGGDDGIVPIDSERIVGWRQKNRGALEERRGKRIKRRETAVSLKS